MNPLFSLRTRRRFELGAGARGRSIGAHLLTLPGARRLGALALALGWAAAAPEAQAQKFYDGRNPVIFLNDQPDDVYVDGYIMSLAHNNEISLRGMISSGVDCNCGAGDNYPKTDTPRKRQDWINAARASGFRNIPDNVNGTQGPKLQRPASGRFEDTQPINSAGSRLIVQEALAAPADRPLLVVCGGPITTLADAYLLDNRIAGRVVVAWLAGLNANNQLSDWNGSSDSWASAIVLAKFRVGIFQVGRDEPYCPESRMQSELPNVPLRQKMIDSGYYKPNYDSDGQPAVSVMSSTYIAQARRVTYDRHQFDRAHVRNDANGDDFYLENGNDQAGSDEWWRAVKKAFAGGGTSTSGSTTGGSSAGSSTGSSSTTGSGTGDGATGSGQGLAGSYFNNRTLTGSAAASRVEGPIDFDWGSAAPSGVGADNFSVRWEGQVEAPTSGSYRFQTVSDDGVRLWINNQQVINNWTDHAPTTDTSASVSLTAGTKYAIRMEFYENAGGAQARLRWILPNQSTAYAIPKGRLYQNSGSATSGTSTGVGSTTSAGSTTSGSTTSGSATSGGPVPSPWTSADVGSAGVAGSASHSQGLFTVRGAGADIWATSDGFHFVHAPLSGDGTLVARLDSMQNTDGWAKAGVMIRESTAANAKHAFMAITPANGAAFQRRTDTGGSSFHTGGTGSAPRWLRLVRSGNTFTGSISTDAANWTTIGTATVSMGAAVRAGLAVTAHNAGQLNAAVFSSVSLTPAGSTTAGSTTASGTTTSGGTTGSSGTRAVVYDGESGSRPLASGLYWSHPAGFVVSETSGAAHAGAGGLQLQGSWAAGEYGWSFGWNWNSWGAGPNPPLAATPATQSLRFWIKCDRSYPVESLRVSLRDAAGVRTDELALTGRLSGSTVGTTWVQATVPLNALTPQAGFNWSQLAELDVTVISNPWGQAASLTVSLDDVSIGD